MDQKTIDALREYYDSTDITDHFAQATLNTQTAAEVLVSTSIRLPQSLVNRIREQAAAAGVSATALMRQWIIERAAAPSTKAVVSVADLEQFIAERAHPIAS